MSCLSITFEDPLLPANLPLKAQLKSTVNYSYYLLSDNHEIHLCYHSFPHLGLRPLAQSDLEQGTVFPKGGGSRGYLVGNNGLSCSQETNFCLISKAVSMTAWPPGDVRLNSRTLSRISYLLLDKTQLKAVQQEPAWAAFVLVSGKQQTDYSKNCVSLYK